MRVWSIVKPWIEEEQCSFREWPPLGPHPVVLPECELVHVAGIKSDMFVVGVVHQLCWPLSPVLFIVYMDRVSRCSQAGFQFGDPRIPSLLFAEVVAVIVHKPAALIGEVCNRVCSDRDGE